MAIIEPEGATIGPDPVASPGDTAPVEEPTTPTTPEAQDVVDHTGDPDWFPRDYVENLRDEAARYRTRSRDYEQVFGEMPEDIRSGWLELAQLAQSEDPGAREYLAELLGFEPTPEDTQQIIDTTQPLTREEAIQIARQEAQSLYEADRQERAQQDAARQEQDAISQIQSRARDDFNIDPQSPDYVLLLKFANDIDPATMPPGQDILSLANQQLQDYHQQQWDAYEGRKRGEAAGSPATAPNGVSPSIAVTPKTWEQARDALHNRLNASPGQ